MIDFRGFKGKNVSNTKLRIAFLTRFKESGISQKMANKSGLKALNAEQTAALQGHYREANSMLIPYFDASGKPIDYHRIRYLEQTGFGTGRKYDQPSGQPPRAYFPRVLDWQRLKRDVTQKLVITEGEMKALSAACKGIPCIGLGGVWSWKSKKLGILFLPELEAFEWQDREVELCFDSDITVKNQVRAALVALGRELTNRGAQCTMILLPDGPDGAKVGLDDYLVSKGKGAVKAFDALERFPILEDEVHKLEIFSNWIYIKAEDDVIDFASGEPLVYRSRAHFLNATQHMQVLNHAEKMVPAATVWYSDPHRQMVARRVFNPTTADRIVYEGKYNVPCLNMYHGLDTEPRRGNVAPMLTLIDALVDGRPVLRKWLTQWLAYPLQNPGAKLNQCVFVYSPIQGVGKTALGEIMLDIYGRHTHGVAISEEDFFGDWNSWLESGLFALCDELSFDGSKKSRSVFKRAITGESLQLAAKYRIAQHIPNRCNFYFTSNSPGGLPLEGSSENRRVLVLEIHKELGEKWFTTEFDAWRRNGGPGHWLYHLLNKVSLKGFNPRGNAPATREMEHAIESTSTGVESWLRDQMLPGGFFYGKHIWSSKQVAALFEAEAHTHHGGRAVGSAVISRGLAANRWHRFGQVRDGSKGRTEVLWLAPGLSVKRYQNIKPNNLIKKWRDIHNIPDIDA
jgi:hypothetical protein